jgi:hypothetical protein
LANQVHELDASQDRLRRPKRFEAEHRPGKAFDCAVILLHDVVKVFDLPDRDRDFPFPIVERKTMVEFPSLCQRSNDAVVVPCLGTSLAEAATADLTTGIL